jgi:hypothetical protein
VEGHSNIFLLRAPATEIGPLWCNAEILVAMMMKDILSERGAWAIGPVSRLTEAMVAAVHDEIDAGVIDINLGGELVYPIADVLTARRIPFVFVTGYGSRASTGGSATCRS